MGFQGRSPWLVFSYDTAGGETTNSIGGSTVRTCARRDGAELVIESWLETLHFKDRWSLSEDGDALTMEHRDDILAGQIVVHEKVTITGQTWRTYALSVSDLE